MDSQYFYRELGAKVAKTAAKDRISTLFFIAFEDVYSKKKDFSSTTAFLEGMMFAQYSFERYKSEKKAHEVAETVIITSNDKLKHFVNLNADEWADTFCYVNVTRDLVNMPANELTPKLLAEQFASSAHYSVTVEIWDEQAILESGLTLVAAVGRGSANPPRFIRMFYNGAPETDCNIALVGKGVTFDSGGSNLKSSDAMGGMKADMGGAALIFSAINLAAARNLRVNIHGYIPLVENIIGADAIRPGDIVRSLSGKTVEILNTDSEGRLILADSLYLATKTNPEVIIDAATLTGACVIALGEYCAGFFTNRKNLQKHIIEISHCVGEDVWELPLYESYSAKLKGGPADLKNIVLGSRYGASIHAALFLREFVDSYPWLHLDVAGPAYLSSEHPVYGQGATGFGVRLVYNFIKSYYQSRGE
jgi:leucyl aminopeptidase